MTTKKATTKKAAKRRPSVRERARRIVADEKGYDEDTRNAVKHSLERGDVEDLAETVRMADSGGIILDTTLVEERQAGAAAALDSLLAMPGLPPWVKDGIGMMLDTNYITSYVDLDSPGIIRAMLEEYAAQEADDAK